MALLHAAYERLVNAIHNEDTLAHYHNEGLMNANPAWPSWARIHRPAVRRYRVMPVAPSVLEVTAVVTLTPACVRAIAFRLEHTANGHPPLSPHSWRCTAVEAP